MPDAPPLCIPVLYDTVPILQTPVQNYTPQGMQRIRLALLQLLMARQLQQQQQHYQHLLQQLYQHPQLH